MLMNAMALAMAMMAMKGDPQDDARKALNNCFFEEHNKAVASKASGAEFNEQLAAACTDERKVYFDILVKGELAFKAKLADAEEYANEEIQSIVDSVTNAFEDNVSSGAKLQMEK
jgi:hypothetical protein